MPVASGSDTEGSTDCKVLSRVRTGAAEGFDRESRCDVNVEEALTALEHLEKRYHDDEDALCGDTEGFHELADDLAMQALCSQGYVRFVDKFNELADDWWYS